MSSHASQYELFAVTGRERERQLATLCPASAGHRVGTAGRRPPKIPRVRGGSYGAEAYGEAYDPNRRRWPDDATAPKRR